MSKKSKIKVYWFHPHFLNWLGGSKFMIEVAKRLNKVYCVEMVADVASRDSRKKFASVGIKIRTLSGFSTNNYLYWILAPFFLLKDYYKLRKIVKTGDIIVTSMFPMNVLAYLLNKSKHVQICFEPFAFFYDTFFINGFSCTRRVLIKIAKFFYSWLDILSTRKANVVLTLSDFNKRWIKKIYGINAKVVYEGVDTKFFRPTRCLEIENKYRNSEVIFHSTDFTRIKGTENIFNAMPYIRKKFPNVKLLISNTLENDEQRQLLKNFARKHGFLGNVEFLGYLEYKLLPKYLSMADIVVQPSIGQSMNLTIKEAMACETPVVTCLEGVEQYEDGTAGYLVNSKKKYELGDKISRLLKDGNLRKKMGANGRKIINERFSWDAVCLRIVEELDSLTDV